MLIRIQSIHHKKTFGYEKSSFSFKNKKQINKYYSIAIMVVGGDSLNEDKLMLCCALCCTNCALYPSFEAIGCSGKVRWYGFFPSRDMIYNSFDSHDVPILFSFSFNRNNNWIIDMTWFLYITNMFRPVYVV